MKENQRTWEVWMIGDGLGSFRYEPFWICSCISFDMAKQIMSQYVPGSVEMREGRK